MNPNYPKQDTNPQPHERGQPLEWSPLPIGSFTGIDYTKPNAAEGLDPYLVWADINGFANLAPLMREGEEESREPEWLPVLISLAKDARAADLVTPARRELIRVPDAYTNSKSSGFPSSLKRCSLHNRRPLSPYNNCCKNRFPDDSS